MFLQASKIKHYFDEKPRVLWAGMPFFLTLLICFDFGLNGTYVYCQAPKDRFTVVLDAGHGGKDSGNRGNGYYEKSIALNIALKVGKILERNSDFKVIYTRKKDVFIELFERARIANRADADLFISIHCDAFSSPRAYGAGTFVLGLHANQRNFEIAKKENSVIFYEENYEENYDGFDPNNPESVIGLTLMQETYLDQSIAAAATIQQSFVRNMKRKDRTVKQAGFIVLKYTYMPSVLIETGFLTNAKEGAYLNSSKGQNQMAQAIAKAIEEYQLTLEASLISEPPSVQVEETTLQKPQQSEKSSDILFRVQLAASGQDLTPKAYNFKGLTPIYKSKEQKIYRYFYGESSSYSSIKKFHKEAKKVGYTAAFIVAFKNGKKIPLQQALDALK
ncbi:MAG: N-acetylmuramoyl-L-alanine amidase family protein [Flavobacteriaceae bacterium]